ncbi:MAG: PP2C family protein-serine/threonine phosphatase, partial [Acidobacteriaceae bacterium]
LKTPHGEIVAELFALRAAHRQPPSANPHTNTAPPDHRPFLLEVALPLKSADTSILTPIRRNLAINLGAALALLATVLLAGIGLRSYVRGRRLEEQIEIARQVQSRLLPSTTIALPGHQLATEYQPSGLVGGDFYDVFPSPTRGFALVIGDVSGKGIPAALLMGVIHGAVRTASWQSTAAHHEEESRKLNLLLCEHASGNRFASMFWCVYDEQLHTLRYVNAGHCPPFLLTHSNGQLVTTRLDHGGPVLGLLPTATYEATTLQISPGDLLVMYSDGLVEANNATGEEFGDDRVATFLQAHANETPTYLRDHLLQTLTTFSPPSDAQDDLTFAILRFNTPAS